MKKVFALLFAMLLAGGLLACGGGGTPGVAADLADGTYKAQMDAYSAARLGQGWADMLSVTVSKGVITEANVDSVNADGQLKSATTAETYPMDPKPSVWLPELTEQVKNAKTTDDIAGVAGASNSSENLRLMLKAILERGVAGEVVYVSIPMADGTYTAEIDKDLIEENEGWTDSLVIVFKGGKVESVTFDSLNAEGEKKSEQTSETYPMEILPSEWMPKLVEQVKAASTGDDIEGVAGATRSSKNIRLLYEAILKEGKPGETITVSAKG